jgi:hypothetical protein
MFMSNECKTLRDDESLAPETLVIEGLPLMHTGGWS